MKKILLALMACVMAFSSCSDDDENDFDLGLIEGSWACVHLEEYSEDGERYVDDYDLDNPGNYMEGMKISKMGEGRYELIDYYFLDGWRGDDEIVGVTIEDKRIVYHYNDGDDVSGNITKLTATNMTIECEYYDEGVKWYSKEEYVRVNSF